MGFQRRGASHASAAGLRGARRSGALILAAALLLSLPAITAEQPAFAVDDRPVEQIAPQQTAPEVGQVLVDGQTAANGGAAADGGNGANGETDGAVADPPPAEDDATNAGADGDASTEAPSEYEEALGFDPFDPNLTGADGGAVSFSPGPEWARDPAASGELPEAEERSTKPGRGKIVGDNYPKKYKNLAWPYPAGAYIWDEWNFAYRQCTSFVAWRLNDSNGIKFSNQYGGVTRWGDAGQWGAVAKGLGYKVNKTPEVGAIAWSGAGYGDASNFGHVAWVARVLDNGNIVIEEYNYNWSGAYKSREVKPSEFQGYIHVKDLPTKKYKKTTTPTVNGAPMVGGTLTASMASWSPKPSKVSYQWTRDGVAIKGATKTTYSPTAADLGAQLRIEATGSLKHYPTTVKRSAATTAVVLTDADGDGIADVHQLLPWNSDVNGDGRPDAVGFAKAGVSVSLASGSGLGAAQTWVADFGVGSDWSTVDHPRTLVDVNGDGRADVVGFGQDGVYVAASTGSGFEAPRQWISGSFSRSNGWTSQDHPRTLADVDGDGLPDLVGFAKGGVSVGLNTGSGFSAPKTWLTGYGIGSGWTTDKHPRWIVDVNGDGLADMVAISSAGVRVGLSNGKRFVVTGSWSSAQFGHGSGWRVGSHPRMLADVTGDGLPDLVGFAESGVQVGVNTGRSFAPAKQWSTDFGAGKSWRVGQHPRTLADVNGDGRDDVVGFKSDGPWVALSTGSGFSAPKRWTTQFASKTWQSDTQPRMLVDANGDGRADIVGFGSDGVRVATSTGSSFATAKRVSTEMAGWRVADYPRGFSLQRLAKAPTPTISGGNVTGTILKASVPTWQPTPVQLSYQWYRDGVAIKGATRPTYRLVSTELGKKVQVRVTGAKAGYARVARSSAKTPTVVLGAIVAGTPKISGTARVGRTLAAKPGAWNVQPDRVQYQWYRNGKAVKGATKSKYTLVGADARARITVRVTGAKLHYSSRSATSEKSATVAKGVLKKAKPKITGTAAVGKRLAVTRGTWTSGAKFGYRWYRDGKAIPGATKSKYRLVAKDRGKRITVRVTGKKDGYTTGQRVSKATSRVR